MNFIIKPITQLLIFLFLGEGNSDYLVSNFAYKLEGPTTKNILTVPIMDFANCIYKAKGCETLWLCEDHLIKLGPVCVNCHAFKISNFAFALETDIGCYLFPAPILYTERNFKALIYFIQRYIDLLARQEKKGKELSESDKQERFEVLCKSHDYCLNLPFNMGKLETIQGTKESVLRRQLLADFAYGARFTLTIDSTLEYGTVSIPKKIWDELKMGNAYVVINRDPSINTRCIYVCTLLWHDALNDNTMHVNSGFLEGLHADSDGDELNLYATLIKNFGTIPTYEHRLAIEELRSMSYDIGKRVDSYNNPRYILSQIEKYHIHVRNNIFNKHPMWYYIFGETFSDKIKNISILGATIMRDEFDSFLKFQRQTFKHFSSITISEILNYTGAMKSIVDSGSKGSLATAKYTINKIFSTEINSEEFIANFNRYVASNKNIGKLGRIQYLYAHTMQAISLIKYSLYMNRNLFVTELNNNGLFDNNMYNIIAIKQTLLFIQVALLSHDFCKFMTFNGGNFDFISRNNENLKKTIESLMNENNMEYKKQKMGQENNSNQPTKLDKSQNITKMDSDECSTAKQSKTVSSSKRKAKELIDDDNNTIKRSKYFHLIEILEDDQEIVVNQETIETIEANVGEEKGILDN